MRNTTTIGRVIHPGWSFDLEANLRVHRMLAERALLPKWRFRTTWVWTGPFETLMGHSNCGTGSPGPHWGMTLSLPVRDGLEPAVDRLKQNILKAICEYPGFASLDETLPDRGGLCREAFQTLLSYDGGRTKTVMNSHHRAATYVRDVRLECCRDGVYVNADVSFNSKPAESRWGLFYLAHTTRPKWNERLKLHTWLSRASERIGELVKPRKPPAVNRQAAKDAKA